MNQSVKIPKLIDLAAEAFFYKDASPSKLELVRHCIEHLRDDKVKEIVR